MKNILILVLVVTILILITVLFINNKKTKIVEDVSVTTATTSEVVIENATTTIVTGGDSYENGSYWGMIKGSKVLNGNLIVSIDFLQSFATRKDTAIAKIEDGYCRYDFSGSPYKTKQDFINKIKSLTEDQVDEFIYEPNEGHCFPNGINYFRNTSTKLRDKIVSSDFIAYPAYANPESIGYMSSNTNNIQVLNAILNDPDRNYTHWNIVLKDNKIERLIQSFQP